MTLSHSRRCHGKVLLSTTVVMLLAMTLVGAILVLASQHHYLTLRSATWTSEIPLAEAGIEEALAHINSSPRRFATNGWTLSGGRYTKTRSFPGGYFYTGITTNQPPMIVSVGYGRIPRQTNFTSRTVVVHTTKTAAPWGIIGKRGVGLNGTTYIDSYDSSDPAASTGGLYDPAKRHDQAGVATLSTNRPAIDTKGARIFGYAATGPGGSVAGNVGDGVFLSTSSGQQPGHVSDDFNVAINDVGLPSPWNPRLGVGAGLISGVLYDYVLNDGDYQFDAPVSLSDSAGIYITGKVRIFFKSDFKMTSSAAVTLAPGATLEIYLGGSMDLNGRCVINPTGIPANCSIYGLPTCTSIKYAGTAAAYAKLYAPNANISIAGTFDFSGSIVGDFVQFSGTANIHYDEALARAAAAYHVSSWEEI